MSQFKGKNTFTEKEKDRTKDNSDAGSVDSEKHYPSPFVKKGNGYINKVRSDMHKGKRRRGHTSSLSLFGVQFYTSYTLI